ncbi:unnamed protein product [Ambrosiozyma monospora]|uniref:Unnamed protein product n=1 Tax=Ambrosiozyma monospora TaxID=43982 RepID=A0ACB5TYI2_AMBMO|nr:unnamed protein product [Ambrosiozyma monospora]
MVLYFKHAHSYKHDFPTVSLAYFNRYPNPYSTHVKSTDTVEHFIDEEGRLHQTKIVMKTGRLPQFIKPFLGKISTSWIVEKSIVDPVNQTMQTYNCNLDHRKIVRIEEYATYKFNKKDNCTECQTTVKFSSGFRNTLNLRDRIENWSKNKFDENMSRSTLGLKIVMDNVRERLSRLKQLQQAAGGSASLNH